MCSFVVQLVMSPENSVKRRMKFGELPNHCTGRAYHQHKAALLSILSYSIHGLQDRCNPEPGKFDVVNKRVSPGIEA